MWAASTQVEISDLRRTAKWRELSEEIQEEDDPLSGEKN